MTRNYPECVAPGGQGDQGHWFRQAPRPSVLAFVCPRHARPLLRRLLADEATFRTHPRHGPCAQHPRP
eukprot:1139753-Pelagomonas_calceolata.AAC.1